MQRDIPFLILRDPRVQLGFNAATKNAIDYLFAQWQHKPAGFKPTELMDASATAMLDELQRWTESLVTLRARS